MIAPRNSISSRRARGMLQNPCRYDRCPLDSSSRRSIPDIGTIIIKERTRVPREEFAPLERERPILEGAFQPDCADPRLVLPSNRIAL